MAETLEQIAAAAAAEAGVPRDLFFGLIRTESNWNPSAISPAGAVGLAQVMPWWASTAEGRRVSGLTSAADLMDPWKNARAGARILADELRRFGNPALALMAYNAGASAVLRAIRNARSNDPGAVSQYLPDAETRAYWRKVLTWAAHYAGQISAARAAVEASGQNLSGTVSTWAKNLGGTSGLLILFAAALAGILILGGRR